MSKLFVTGNATSGGILPKEVTRILQDAIQREIEICISDAHGFESLVQQWLYNKRYPDVTIYYTDDKPKCIKSHRWATVKVNAEMYATPHTRLHHIYSALVKDCDFGFIMWNRTNTILEDVIVTMIQKGKPVGLYTFQEPFPTTRIKTMEQFDDYKKRSVNT